MTTADTQQRAHPTCALILILARSFSLRWPLDHLNQELASAKEEAGRVFPQEEELAEKSARLAKLNAVLDHEENGHETEAGEQVDGSARDADAAVEGAGTQKNAQRTVPGMTAWEAAGKQEPPGKKPSILREIKEYKPPAPGKPVPVRGREQEVI